MKISVVIPILYSPKNTLYQKALESVVRAWKKAGKRVRSHSLTAVLVFNDFSSTQKLPMHRTNIKVDVITSALNRGFTGAVNDGVWFAVYQQEADWCFVLNDDAVVDPDFFQLIEALKPAHAVVSCGVRNLDGSLQSTGLAYLSTGLTSPLTRFTHTPYFSGTAFFVSRKLIQESFRHYGWLLAEFFFAYAEDVELSVRLWRARKKIYIFPRALVAHAGSLTAKRGSQLQLYWGYRNLLYVIILHWPTAKILLSLPMLMVGQLNALAILLFKGYWFVYPKIVWSVWKNRAILRLYRKKFDEKLTDRYSI